jgi:hypothetical protein
LFVPELATCSNPKCAQLAKPGVQNCEQPIAPASKPYVVHVATAGGEPSQTSLASLTTPSPQKPVHCEASYWHSWLQLTGPEK